METTGKIPNWEEIAEKLELMETELGRIMKSVKSLRAKSGPAQNWLSKVSVGMDEDQIKTDLWKLKAEVTGLANLLDEKYKRLFGSYDKFVVETSHLRKRLQIMKSLRRLLEENLTPDQIESKMARLFDGDFIWRGELAQDKRLESEVHVFLAASTDSKRASAKSTLLETLEKAIKEVEPTAQAERRGIRCLQAREEALESKRIDIAKCVASMQTLSKILVRIEAQEGLLS